MTDIDYEALAKMAYESNRTRGGTVPEVLRLPEWDLAWDAEREFWRYGARAVVAALAEQGLAVVLEDDLRYVWEGSEPFDRERYRRIFAALAAPPPDDPPKPHDPPTAPESL